MKKPRTKKYWQRHREQKCDCGGYWFPHRVKSGLCHQRVDSYEKRMLEAKWRSQDSAEVAIELAWEGLFAESVVPGSDIPF